MIASIKNRVWDILKEKEVSLAMLYNGEGRILWSRGRPIRGRTIAEGDGFSRSSVERTLHAQETLRQESVAITLSGVDLPRSARLLFVKSLLIVPVSESYFLYVDSGVKDSFSPADVEVIKAMGGLLGEMVESFREGESPAGSLGGVSPAMALLRERVVQYAMEEEPVLLSGETGVGKNRVAELIHRLSGRRGSFVIVHTPAIPENLFESELFGHRAGAFTDAKERKPGLLEEAEGGSLFFDEIAEVPTSFQSKLLRFVDTRRYRPLGDTKERHSDVRIMAATNRDLAEGVRQNSFRKDLYYRLSVLPLEIPPLRLRKEDIRPLALENATLLRGKKIGPKAWEILMGHDWPGNVRELLHVLKRSGILLAGPVIGPEMAEILEKGLGEEEENTPSTPGIITLVRREVEDGKSFWDTAWKAFIDRDLNRLELRQFLEEFYGSHGCSLKATAEALHVDVGEYPRFVSMLHKYGIHPKKKKPS